MQFVHDGDFYKVARITGPQHNFLAIRLAEIDSDIEIIPLPIKLGESMKVNEAAVLGQVKSGLALANKEVGVLYFTSCAQYVPSDTPSSSVYEVLTVELIRRLHAGWDS
jgi:hypothetical protein